MCIELNAHALITFLITLRDTPSADKCFMPWFLGSQSCEKIFRAARSMSSTFSTMINFGMLGFLRRLHRMQIQIGLEAGLIPQGSRAHVVNHIKIKMAISSS